MADGEVGIERRGVESDVRIEVAASERGGPVVESARYFLLLRGGDGAGVLGVYWIYASGDSFRRRGSECRFAGGAGDG